MAVHVVVDQIFHEALLLEWNRQQHQFHKTEMGCMDDRIWPIDTSWKRRVEICWLKALLLLLVIKMWGEAMAYPVHAKIFLGKLTSSYKYLYKNLFLGYEFGEKDNKKYFKIMYWNIYRRHLLYFHPQLLRDFLLPLQDIQKAQKKKRKKKESINNPI
jgi:hypothetical protein